MSPRRTRTVPLIERLDALSRGVEALDGVAPQSATDDAREVLERIDRRRALSAEHTVVGLFGATGSGKSSLVNAIVGRDVTRAAVRRPTTAKPVAAILGEGGSEPLLDWLEVGERVVLDGTGCALEAAAQEPVRGRRGRRSADADPEDLGVVVLDLPDLDSVEAANREVAERMTGLVDLLVWVTDPQKYADAVLHHEFVRRFAGHDAVTLFVLNQIDRVRLAEREAVVRSLEGIVRADGLEAAPVLAASAESGEGIDELRARIIEAARTRETAAARQRADVSAAAVELRAAADPAGMPASAARADIDALVEDLAAAARVEPVAEAVGASYRHRSARRTGWPLLRWMRRLRPDPLGRWNIDQGRDEDDLARTSLPEADAATRARASGGVRRFADSASAGGTDPWRAAVRREARSREESLPDALDQAVAGADLHGRRGSWWWPVLDVVQWLALLTWVAGLGWLGLNAALRALAIPPPPMPMICELWIPIPLPVAMIVVGLALGILLGGAAAAVSALVAGSRRRRARRILRGRVREVAQRDVVAPVDAALERARTAASDLALAAGTASDRRV